MATGSGDNHTVGWICVKASGQTYTLYSNPTVQWRNLNPRQCDHLVDPAANVDAENQASFFHEHRDLP